MALQTLPKVFTKDSLLGNVKNEENSWAVNHVNPREDMKIFTSKKCLWSFNWA